MKLNPILSYYSTEKYNQINRDYNNLVSVVNSESDDKNKSIFSINTRRETKDLSDYIHQNQLLTEELKQRTDVGDSVPAVGKIGTIVDKIKENDYIPAAGLASLALLNGPEDIREAMSAYKQIKALCTGKQYENLMITR